MGDKRRRPEEGKFLKTHFSSGGKLAVNDSIRGAGIDVLREIVLHILEDGETVTRALKRLRPAPKQARGNKKRRQNGAVDRQRGVVAAVSSAKAAADFIAEMQGETGQEVREEEEAEKKRDFDRLTEAASELLDLGHEDIYQQSREQLVVSLGRGNSGAQIKGTYVWHDDGQSVPRQHDPLDDITTFRDLPSTSGRSDGVPYRRAGLGTKAEAGQDSAPEGAEPDPAPKGEPIEERNRRLSNTTAAKAAVGAWDFRSGVPYTYEGKQQGAANKPGSSLMHEPQLTRTQRPPPVPKLAPLPPAPVRPGGPTDGGYPFPQAPTSATFPAYPGHHAGAYPYAPPPPHAGQWQQPPLYGGYPPPHGPVGPPPAAVPYPGAEHQGWQQQQSGAAPPAYPQWHP
ncbi:hypothetical protein COCOBI_07-2560 [Coccomyxa sp. Obi]|nr:hypothetical protein COCOBI_07-2560 [Coccomyxa sp. Obi]